MKGNVINLNTLHLNSVRLNGIGKVQSVSLKGGSTEDPVFPPVEPPIEPEPTPTYTLSASVANGVVSAKRNGSAVNLPYTANDGDVIVVQVTPNDGYAFEGWNDGNTDNPRSITMTADVALSAQCVEVVQPPVGNYIQFEDAEVERELMANGVSSDGIGITKEDAENVASIGDWFKNNTTATSFNEINYFKNVKTIQAGAFYKATNLVIDDLNLPNLDKIYYGAFNSTKLKKISSLGNVTQFMNAASGLGGTFQNCGDLTKVSHNVFANITNLGDSAFMQCTNLRIDLILPHLEGVMTSAFSKTPIRRVLDLGKITAFFADNALGWATLPLGSEYTLMILPATLERIGRYAFAGDGNLQVLIIKAVTPPSLASSAWSQSKSTCPIYVPDGSVAAYQTATDWTAKASRIRGIGQLATDNPTLYAEIQQYL